MNCRLFADDDGAVIQLCTGCIGIVRERSARNLLDGTNGHGRSSSSKHTHIHASHMYHIYIYIYTYTNWTYIVYGRRWTMLYTHTRLARPRTGWLALGMALRQARLPVAHLSRAHFLMQLKSDSKTIYIIFHVFVVVVIWIAKWHSRLDDADPSCGMLARAHKIQLCQSSEKNFFLVDS